MILRRVGFVSLSLTEILRRSHRCCSTSSSSTRTTTNSTSSAATTLWSVSSTATRERSLASVEDMFGQVEGEENITTALLTSSTHVVDGAFFDWEDDISSGAVESVRDLCLESVMNAALGELHTTEDLSGVKEFSKVSSHSGNRTRHITHSENIVLDNDDEVEDVSKSTDNDRGGGTIMGRTDDEDVVGINDESPTNTTTPTAGITEGGMTSKLDAVNVEFDNDEEDASSLVTEEEEEEVERLLRETQTSESTSALFFKDQTHRRNSAKTKTTTTTAKIKTTETETSAFDDAAAEGAELESVGEVMPSPQRV
ncbi:Type IVb secretion [Trypanosoma melophagium]|uniref:Type IVb secretion n=1 Tax=Trypanosoma melophagium TaxID=715481 RepID=UPI003519FA55|nr:Type IVb secretion [Trypanosoma melophagium]